MPGATLAQSCQRDARPPRWPEWSRPALVEHQVRAERSALILRDSERERRLLAGTLALEHYRLRLDVDADDDAGTDDEPTVAHRLTARTEELAVVIGYWPAAEHLSTGRTDWAHSAYADLDVLIVRVAHTNLEVVGRP